MAERIAALTPALEAYVAKGMADFGVPGVAVGLVTGDRLVYAKGFGVGRAGGAAVDSGTVFQIGSTTKACFRRRWPSPSIAASSPGTTG